MKTAILGAGLLAGAVAGSVAGFLVQWEVTDWLIRHSRYREYANGHLVQFRRQSVQ